MFKTSFIIITVSVLMLLTSFRTPITDRVAVEIQILTPITQKEIVVIISVKNLSDSSLSVLKSRRYDFYREKIKPLGNYLIEIERFSENQFSSYSPTADIDPVYPKKEEYKKIDKNEVIVDTIKIQGYIFEKREFRKGKYRIRIAFNSDEWGNSEQNISDWVAFKID